LSRTVLKAPCWGHLNKPICSCSLWPFLSGRPVIFHVFSGSATFVLHFGHLALFPFAVAVPAKYICPSTILTLTFPLRTISESMVVKSATAKVEILEVSSVLKSVSKWTPAIISLDVNAFSLRSLRNWVMSFSIWVWGLPVWNSVLSMGIWFFPLFCGLGSF